MSSTLSLPLIKPPSNSLNLLFASGPAPPRNCFCTCWIRLVLAPSCAKAGDGLGGLFVGAVDSASTGALVSEAREGELDRAGAQRNDRYFRTRQTERS